MDAMVQKKKSDRCHAASIYIDYAQIIRRELQKNRPIRTSYLIEQSKAANLGNFPARVTVS